jgi:hypothetical protein
MPKLNKKKKAVKKPKTTLDLVLEGSIYCVEKDKKGNVISQSEIDGKTVLQILVNILEDRIDKEYSNCH